MGAGHAHSHDHGGHAVQRDGRGHGHGHGHSHAPADFGRAFAIGIVLNTVFVIIEATYGFLSGSMALVADAGHNLSDVLALILAWGASIAAKKPPTARFTYGYKSSTILAALVNAALLFVAMGAILYETLHRLAEPPPVQGMTMIIVAGIGIVINLGTALLFLRGREDDLNIRGAFLHMAADALVSVGVVLAGILILYTDARWIDPMVSLIIVAVIGWGTWGLAKDSLKLGLLGVPAGIEQPQVERWLAGLDGVEAVHDLHIWPMSTTETALTAHLVMPAGHPGDTFLRTLSDELRAHHRIGHATIQIEQERDCRTGC
ncbi:putative zinc transporter MSC2 [Alteripontixanthobacter maritimus]|uniref:Putative zinc transporter MSC2 n=1 Tax=Alteripontixanthobacter maritimus TaxID=2161824 RepID=A0A369Q467_9SPHN|nr:cation diffusion facilitator family transporter [Alteripontixanthobacter maritimus]RDC59240.1 putative zinc transporter MSC2 [Alteripontixanthobacter maritimus]